MIRTCISSDFDGASSLIYGNKMPTRCNRRFLLQILSLAQHVSGHHYAHHQELESIIQMVAACGILCFGFQVVGMVWSWELSAHHTDNLKTKAQNTTGSNHLYNTLELLMMGIIVPETCWASNKICNKKRLLHLVGILCPSSGAQEYYTDVAACGILCFGFQVVGMVWSWELHTIPTTWKPKHKIPQAATICIILLSSWWWA